MARPQTAAPKQPQVGFHLPNYVLIQLRTLAVRKNCSMRHLVLTALQSLGLHVEQIDLIADSRKTRQAGTRTNYARKASGKNCRT